MAKNKQKKSTPSTTQTTAFSLGLSGQFPAFFSDVKIMGAILFVISFALYANTLGHDFTQDDAIVITENEFVEQGIAGIPEILKYDTFRGFFKVEGKDNLVSGGRYRPFTLIMFATGYSIFGENPFIYHFMNVVWYGITVVLLYLVLLRLLESPKRMSYAYFVAFVTALIFAVHPIHTEVVANIKGRDEIMTLFGSLAALYCTLEALRTKGENKEINWLIASAIFFFIGILSKELTVVFLVLAPLALWVFKKASLTTIAKHTAPMFGAFLLFMLIRTMVLGGGSGIGGEAPRELMNNPFLKIVGGNYVDFTASERFATIFHTLGEYLRLLVFPHPLTHDYYPRHIEMMSWSDISVSGALLAYIGIGILALVGCIRRKAIGFGAAMYLGSLGLVSNIIFPIGTNMAERFLFMPTVGFALIVAVLLYMLSQKIAKADSISNFKQYTPAFAIVGIIVLLGFGKTVTRNTAWANNFTLFQTDVHTSPNSAKLRNAMGGELTVQSQLEPYKGTPEEQEMLRAALEHTKEALVIHPNYKSPYLIQGNAHYYLGELEQAVAAYRNAIALDPNFADAKRNLSVALEDAGKKAGEARQFSQSLTYFKEATELRPDDPKLRFFLGTSYGQMGQPQQAIQQFLAAKKLSTDSQNDIRIYGSLVAAYKQLGNAAKVAEYEQKLRQAQGQ